MRFRIIFKKIFQLVFEENEEINAIFAFKKVAAGFKMVDRGHGKCQAVPNYYYYKIYINLYLFELYFKWIWKI